MYMSLRSIVIACPKNTGAQTKTLLTCNRFSSRFQTFFTSFKTQDSQVMYVLVNVCADRSLQALIATCYLAQATKPILEPSITPQ